MQSENQKSAMWIAILSTVFDQLYHIIKGYTHQIFFIFDAESGTVWYVGLKFLFIYTVALFILNKQIFKSNVSNALAISIAAAWSFGILLSYMFPQQYTTIIHMAHGVGIFIASMIVFAKKDWW